MNFKIRIANNQRQREKYYELIRNQIVRCKKGCSVLHGSFLALGRVLSQVSPDCHIFSSMQVAACTRSSKSTKDPINPHAKICVRTQNIHKAIM